MQKLKHVLASGAALALAGCLSVALTACGGMKEGVAATWANGEIEETQVTNYIENMRSMYGFSSDESGWEEFLKNRTYDTQATSSLEELEQETKEAEAKEDGTVADYRSYVIEQIARDDVVEWEAGQRDLAVSDEELDEAVEANRAQVEAQYMAGTFESILEMQGYKSIDDYKEALKAQLQIDKLKEQVVGSSDTDENWDQSKWDSFVDGLMAYADLKIGDMPSGLSYDPETINSADADADTDADEDADADADATDDASAEAEGESGESESEAETETEGEDAK